MQLPALLRQVDTLLGQKDDMRLKSLLLGRSPKELAHVIDNLTNGKRKTFATLPPELQAEVVLRMNDESKEYILPKLSDHTLARFLHFAEEDNAADVLQIVPDGRRPGVLQYMKPDKRVKIEKLLLFGPETAGGIMDLNFIVVPPGITVPEVTATVREHAREHKQVPVVMVAGSKGTGWVPARALVSAAPGVNAGDLARPMPAVNHTADREKVLALMGRENADVVRVTDEHHKTLGVIHLHDLLWVAQAEASEDVYRMGAVGLLDAGYLESKFSTIWRKRVGWLSILFIAELFTFTALAHFESSIAAVTALALFVPLCISTGGNSGSQAATLVTRAMALGHVTTRDWWRVMRRELLMGVALGGSLGIVGFVRAFLTPQEVLGGIGHRMIGVVIGLSVAIICLWGTLVGSMLPVLFKKLGFDPGYASSPFVATFVDVTGIIIYFSIASALILA
ncbi:magnesium transporter [Candidatus Peregrinibacteria bacterium]|nr:magnesium transporter [Candidatus Peregrinibacteria bacterium]